MMTSDIEILHSLSSGDKKNIKLIFTEESKLFLFKLVSKFNEDVANLLSERKKRKLHFETTNDLPTFNNCPDVANDRSWKISPVPPKLRCRNIDVGDVSPADDQRFKDALNADVDGIQVDFDDGHCPSWSNQLRGWSNILHFVSGTMDHVPSVSEAPVLMLRPRAWNMTEYNVLVSGQVSPAPLVDFGVLMFHVAGKLSQEGAGPFFYLSKLESAQEAALWRQIFVWTENELGLTRGTIRACVLIENVLATFEMDQILWELREHSAGLNCGVWDYSASFVAKFGRRKEFMLPDRSKYVNMNRRFLSSYRQLLVATAHARGAPATGGMAAIIVDSQEDIDNVIKDKRKEIEAGVDGFLIYDLALVDPCRQLWTEMKEFKAVDVNPENITVEDLISLPTGGVTMSGLKLNIEVAVVFIHSWCVKDRGCFIHDGRAEDSATAEISRSQVWQWIYHGARLEEDGEMVTSSMVRRLVDLMVENSNEDMKMAGDIFMDIVTRRDMPDFITTLLNDSYYFRFEKLRRKTD